MKSAAIATVFEFIYTGKASISTSNAQDLVVASDYLIVQSLKTNCLALEGFRFSV